MAFLAGALVAFYGTLLFALNGYLNWGNFSVPLAADQLSPAHFVWNPYFLNGSLTFLPPQALLVQVTESVPILAMTALVGFSGAEKLYVLLSTLFMSGAFYYLCRIWGSSPTGTFLATLIFTFSPLELRCIAGGDFLQFVSVGFLILSIALLIRFVHTGLRSNRLLLYSLVMLAMTAGTLQLTLIGTALFFVAGTFFVLERYRFRLREAVRPLLVFLGKATAILPIFAFIFVPLIFGGAAYSTGSLTAVVLPVFARRSVPVLGMLTFSAYTPATAWDGVEQLFGPRALTLWTLLEATLFIGVLLSPLFLRRPRQLFAALVVLTCAVVGAGPTGPVGPLVSYMYVNVPGYAALNAPWFWLIGPIAIFYGLMAGQVIDALLVLRRQGAGVPAGSDTNPWRFELGGGRRHPRAVWAICLVIALVALLVVLPPIVSQSYYRTDSRTVIGIVSNPIPADYAAMYSQVQSMASPNQSGVAFFNPDLWTFLRNTTDQFSQPFVQFPLVRTPGLPYYGTPSPESNYFFYWLYKLFYSNGTRFLGGLMGLEGVSVFATLYGTNSASFNGTFLPSSYNVNASQLMPYQTDVGASVSGKDYGIFRTAYLVPGASPYSTTTTVLGDYNTLNRMAYAGWNLTRQAIRFAPDITSTELPQALDDTAGIVLSNANELLDLALPASGAIYSDPLGGISNSVGPVTGWSNSLRDYGLPVVDASPGPVAFTTAQDVLSLPLNVSHSGNYQLWVKVFRGPQAGPLDLSIQSQVARVDAGIPYRGQFNSFVWTPLNLSLLAGPSTLAIRSTGGWAGVESVFLASPSRLAQAEQSLYGDIGSSHIPVSLSEDPTTLATTVGQSSTVVTSNGGSPGGTLLSVTPSGGGSASLTIQSPTLSSAGSLWFLVGSNSSGVVRISAPGNPTLVLNFTSQGRSSPQSWGWYSYNLSGQTMITPVGVAVSGGSLKLGDIEYVPTSLERIGRGPVSAGSGPVSGAVGGVVPVPIRITYQASGYLVDAGCGNTSVLVRSPYWSALTPTGGEARAFPLMGGADTGITRPAGCGPVAMVAKAWTATLIGVGLSVGASAALWLEPPLATALGRWRGARRRSVSPPPPAAVPVATDEQSPEPLPGIP